MALNFVMLQSALCVWGGGGGGGGEWLVEPITMHLA